MVRPGARRAASMSNGASRTSGQDDLTGFLVQLLERSGPRLLLLHGPAGAGKSSLLHALASRLSTPWVYTLYLQPAVEASEADARPKIGGATTILWMNPRRGAEGAAPAPPMARGHLPNGVEDLPPEFIEEVGRLQATPSATTLVDSWDRDSERFVRDLAPGPSAILTADIPASGFAGLQSTLLSLRVNAVLAVVPELAAPLQSLADSVVELREESKDGARLRVAHITKLRGASQGPRDQLYTLVDGYFRCFPDLPKGFLPPPATPDPDPAGDPVSSLWPGSADFARAFGRLRFGGFTGLSISAGVTEAFATAIAQPIAAHVIRSHGRVVWAPPPALRPSRVLALLKEGVPPDWLRERLRIVSPLGVEPGLGDLGEVVLPLRRELGTGGDLRTATAPGVGPVFPDAYHFLQRAPDGAPALYILSVEGLKASAAVVGLPLNPSTLPAVLASYTKLPRFHGFGYGQIDDPLSTALLPAVDSHLDLRMQYGRAVLTGQRPRTTTYVLDWPGSERRYQLVPCS